ncbi:MAG: prepilin peptidase [Chloroflexi bacterium]|nr:prepilin peptidase [Chloroflexota bacterium]
MNEYGLAFNLLVGLLIGLAVNWLADWLPAYGRTDSPALLVRHWRRWAGVLVASSLFGGYLFAFPEHPTVASPARDWMLWLFFALFLLILVVDLEHRRVLNVVVYPMACVGLILATVRPDLSFASAVIGALVGFASFFLLFLLRPGGLGAGDVKLAGLIGLLVGFPEVSVALIAAIGLGGVSAAFLLLLRRVGRRGTMAYAPYLSLGAMVALLYGPAIIAWYLGRFGIL